MQYPPLNYIEPVYRPPSEARSLILQVTNGCSWNRCTFCEMYTDPQKKFRPKPEDELLEEIKNLSERASGIKRIFLADGDAMVLSARRLLTILQAIQQYFPEVSRVSAYCLPRNLNNKSDQELLSLKQAGLTLLYVGAESGDDNVLELVSKGETFDSTMTSLNRLKQAGIKRSVMILNGLGGQQYSRQHAINSARLANATQPEYLATLVVTFYKGQQRFQEGFAGEFKPLEQSDLFQEMEWLLEELDLEKTIFRSDHASNSLVLKGVLGRDKQQLLNQVRAAITDPQGAHLRPEWQRGF
ncbi:radical SAM protein [Motiliproteus sp. MSK22-1]|uniref:radical SAM protein n=1 Tax=Motiliproteus sp. MSK22-1 TaxID=1897630 RepID=UPI00097A55AC|nr:radical SAM protein [Motiliproteus sp. MSK22-1]OMH32664.1 radical SAM protein [Motiliproteus sp. MSK22-1]